MHTEDLLHKIYTCGVTEVTVVTVCVGGHAKVFGVCRGENFFFSRGNKICLISKRRRLPRLPGLPHVFFYLFSILKCKCFISEIEWIFKIRDRAASGLGTTLCGMKKKSYLCTVKMRWTASQRENQSYCLTL